MKARKTAMCMLGAVGFGALAATLIMTDKTTKRKATKLVNKAMGEVDNKLNKMS